MWGTGGWVPGRWQPRKCCREEGAVNLSHQVLQQLVKGPVEAPTAAATLISLQAGSPRAASNTPACRLPSANSLQHCLGGAKTLSPEERGAPGTGDKTAAEPGPYFWGRSPSLGVRDLCLPRESPAGCGPRTRGCLGREDLQVSWSLKGKKAKCNRCHHLVVPIDTSLARWV